MLEEEAIVIETMGATARVLIEKKSACASCSAALLCHPPEHDYVEVDNLVGAVAGQKVKIVVEPKTYLQASFILYGIPVFVFLFSALIGKIAAVSLAGEAYSDLWAFAVACFFTGATFALIARFQRQAQKSCTYKPIITEIIGLNV